MARGSRPPLPVASKPLLFVRCVPPPASHLPVSNLLCRTLANARMPCTSFARKLHELCRKRCAQTLERTPRPVFCGYLGKAPLLGRVLLLPAPPEYLATHASSQLNSSGACDGPARCCIARGVPTRSLYRQPWLCGEGGVVCYSLAAALGAAGGGRRSLSLRRHQTASLVPVTCQILLLTLHARAPFCGRKPLRYHSSCLPLSGIMGVKRTHLPRILMVIRQQACKQNVHKGLKGVLRSRGGEGGQIKLSRRVL